MHIHTEQQHGKWQALVRLPDGPLDLIGDVHGEIDALRSLTEALGYNQAGEHPESRTLVFLGDLIDRGPDSPGVVELVKELVGKGRAVAIMGNHDLNAAAGLEKADNSWLLGHGPVHAGERAVSGSSERAAICSYLNSLPVAGWRDDLRVVHACWNDDALAALATASDPTSSLREYRAKIKARLVATGDALGDATARNLAHQNENPIKLLTSGPERLAAQAFFAGGKMRLEERHAWWDTYIEGPIVVFGHYWRLPIETLHKDDGLFGKYPLNALLGAGLAMCIDYSVGGRASERRAGEKYGPPRGRLAALRWPERRLVFDNGEETAMATAVPRGS